MIELEEEKGKGRTRREVEEHKGTEKRESEEESNYIAVRASRGLEIAVKI